MSSLKKLLRFLLSRTFLIGVLALIQIGVFAATFLWLNTLGTVAYTLLTLVSVLVVVIVFERDNLNPAYKIMWVLLVVAMPVSGAVFYLWWGNRRISPRKAKQFYEIEKNAAAAMIQQNAMMERLHEQDSTLVRSAVYLQRNGSAPLYSNTSSEYFPFGQDFFERFLEQIKAAQHSIFMEYFIIEEGEMWDKTLEILMQKAAEGVDVRLLYDSFGCLFTLPGDYDEKLRRCGIKCYPFNPIHFSWHISDYKMLNHRDHRKIAIIDGETGFTGGINFADEYINKKQRFGVWKDTGFLLKGPGVFPLTVTFLKMWDFVTTNNSPYSDYAPRGVYADVDFVQPYCDSPLDDENVAESAYFNVIQRAEKYVDIVTPYLIIDNEMVTALCLAAKSGVEVRILTPGMPDKWYVYYVTQSYYPQLLRAGVHIYEYTPGFVHAKMYASDDKIAIVGSANMDYRSLYLHFENCCTFYGGHMVRDVKADIDATISQSREVTLADTAKVPLYKGLCQVLFRFFAPMM
ncbi:MAG: cardiolipin synthase [Ruthenibacterium sp.]